MGREVITEYAYKDQAWFEVERRIRGTIVHPTHTETEEHWQALTQNNGEPKRYDEEWRAEEAAKDAAKLYHEDTRVVRVTP